MKFRFLLVATGLACALLPEHAHAQAFLSDPRIADGAGVKAGDLELHPGVAGEFGYDSNYFQRSGTGDENEIGAYRLRLTPSLSVQSYGGRAQEEGGGPPPTVKFNGRASVSYNHLIAADSQDSDDVSKQSHLAGHVAAGLDILPGRPVGADLGGDYTRTVEASNDPDTANAFRRHTVRGRAGVTWRPGGGLFTWRIGYAATVNIFSEEGFDDLNNVRHMIETQGRWRFLPRTNLIYRGDVSWLSYPDGQADRHDGQILRTEAGINGLVSSNFGFLALVGWGATFFDGNNTVSSRNFDSFTGQAEVTWYPMPQPKLPDQGAPVGLSSVSAGYHRTFAASYLGDYYQRDRIYGNLTYFMAQRFVLSLSGGLGFITRPEAPATPVTGEDGEKRADATVFAEYRPGDSLGINLTYRYDAAMDAGGIGQPQNRDDLDFTRHQIYLGLRWFL